MRVLVTGGTGNVGKAAVRRLLAAGNSVTVVGRSDATVPDGATYRRCDVTDFEDFAQVATGHDAIVHLAAIRSPLARPGRQVFGVNTQGTFNVYEAAAELGISRVVNASSINALGMFFGDRSPQICYLPVDEDHPGLTTDAYSFSKLVTEQIGTYFYERDGITGVSLRLPEVLSDEQFKHRCESSGGRPSETILRLLELSDTARALELERLHTEYDRYRAARRMDKLTHEQTRDGGGAQTDLTRDERHHMLHHVNLYAYLHEDDSAQAIEQAVTGAYDGHHTLFVNASDNTTGMPIEELRKLFWPRLPELHTVVDGGGDTCLPSIVRARDLLGFSPDYLMTG